MLIPPHEFARTYAKERVEDLARDARRPPGAEPLDRRRAHTAAGSILAPATRAAHRALARAHALLASRSRSSAAGIDQ